MEYKSLQERTRMRLVREGGCVVLRAEARWWEQTSADGADLFSSTYRQAADAFLAWAEQTVGNMAKEEYRRAGQGGAHRFRRYGCRYNVDIQRESSEDECLIAVITATLTRVGQPTPLAEETRRFVWKVNQTDHTLTTIRPEARRHLGIFLGKKTQKVRKT